MPTILIYPGQQGAPVPLLDVLREAHDAARASRQAEIDARTKARIPLDDSTNWQEVGELVARASLAHGERDSAKVAAAARELVAATDGNALAPIGDFVAPDGVDGIVVTMQVVDDATRRLWTAQTQAAWMAIRDASKTDDVMARREAYDRLERAYETTVVGVVAKLDGLQGLKPTVAESMPALRLAGLLLPLYSAARHFLELPPGKAVRCGLPPLST